MSLLIGNKEEIKMNLQGKKCLYLVPEKVESVQRELLAKVGAQPVIYDGNKDLDKETVIKKFQIATILKYMQENFRKKCRRDWIWQC